MQFWEALDAIVTKDEAAEEIEKHGHDASDFFKEHGEREEYRGETVLSWLGY
jgi:hypothetical protein